VKKDVAGRVALQLKKNKKQVKKSKGGGKYLRKMGGKEIIGKGKESGGEKME